MKKIHTILFIVALLALWVQPVEASLTYGADYYQTNIRSLGKGLGNNDPLYLFMGEAETLLNVIGSGEYLSFTPGTAPATPAEGMLYYDAASDNLIYYNGSGSWMTLGISSSGTLDEAYNAGNGITVDGSAVTLTVTDAANNAALSIVQNDATNDPDAMNITSAADASTAVGLQIDCTAGYDIQGTGDSWNISIAGLASLVGIATTAELDVTAADVLFDSTYDVAFDANRNQLILQDNAVLGIGGAHDAAADVTFKWDATNLLIEAATDNTGQIRLGSTNSMDLAIYNDAADSIALFDISGELFSLNGWDILLQDGDILNFGDSSDFYITATNQACTLGTLTSDESSAWNFGADTDGDDVKLFGATTGSYFLWDASADAILIDKADIAFSEGDGLLFGDALGTGDIRIDATSNLLTVGQVVAGTGSVAFGVDDHGLDVKMFGDTASAYWLWDTSEDTMSVVGGNVTVTTDDAEANQFKVDATGAVAGVAIQLETTDGGIKLLADGATGGDITLDAEDDIILTTTGKLTITNTEAMTVSGATTLTGAVTATAGVQSASVSVTSTSDGLTTGLIPSGTSFATVTSDSADKVVVLPAAVVGNVIRITSPTTGCELETLASSNATINGVDCDGTNQCALTANNIYVVTCIAADKWVICGWTNAGAAQATIVPDAD